MHKIAICGCGGSGKSALARQLAKRLDLPVTHLDMEYYDERWNPLGQDDFAALQERLVGAPYWILDGNYASTMPIRLAAADTVIFLDIHPSICLWGILQRRRHYRGTDELSRHLRGRLSWGFVKYVLGYRKTMRPKVHELFGKHATGTVVTLTSRRAARRYLGAVSTGPEQR